MKQSDQESSSEDAPRDGTTPANVAKTSSASIILPWGNLAGGAGGEGPRKVERPKSAMAGGGICAAARKVSDLGGACRGKGNQAAKVDRLLALPGGKMAQARLTASEVRGQRAKAAWGRARSMQHVSMLTTSWKKDPPELDKRNNQRMEDAHPAVFEKRRAAQEDDLEVAAALIACSASPVLSSLSEDARLQLARVSRMCTAPDASIVLGFDDTWTACVLMRGGTLEVCQGGELFHIATLGPGQSLGVSACANKDPCQVVAIARGDCSYLEFDRTSLVPLVMSCKEARKALAEANSKMFSTRLAFPELFAVPPFAAPPIPLLPLFRLERGRAKESAEHGEAAKTCSRLKALGRECEVHSPALLCWLTSSKVPGSLNSPCLSVSLSLSLSSLSPSLSMSFATWYPPRGALSASPFIAVDKNEDRDGVLQTQVFKLPQK